MGLCAVVALGLLGIASVLQAQSKVNENHLKAAFLFHFFELVDWPPEALGADSQPLLLCTLGDDPLGGVLGPAMEGQSVGARPIHLRHLTQPQDFQGCHALFIGRDVRQRITPLLAKLKDGPVLTVGETDDFAKQGGMIGLWMEGEKVRLDINLETARRARLKISSRLLLLARNVIGGRG